MKKIILLLSVLSVLSGSCTKENNKPKQTRLKTYTHDYYTRTTPASLDKYTIEYNSANKISKVLYENNGVLYSTKYCVYNSSNLLDSIVERNTSGIIINYYKITWTGNKITMYGDTQLTYNSNGLIDKKIYSDGSYFRNEYRADSIFFYYKPVVGSESLRLTYKLSSTIKNPFLIPGFEAEAFVTGILFYYNNEMIASLPNIEIQEIGTSTKNYTFEGDFNSYPLKRNDLTNTLDVNKSKETFTYEEF